MQNLYNINMAPFKQVVLGGTFDLLHLGHQKLLLKAFEQGEKVVIGLTEDAFNNTRGKKTYQDETTRRKYLKIFLNIQGFKGRYKILSISDIYGQADINPVLEAIIVTPETRTNAHLINKRRLKKGFQPLFVIEVTHSLDEQKNRISSTRIRNGEIDSEGRNMAKQLQKIAGQILSETVKKSFKKPLGKLLTNPPKPKGQKVITVGDITTQNFLKHGFIPNLAIIDLKTKRQQLFQNIAELGFDHQKPKKVPNPSGMISQELIKAIQNTKKSLILVEGEEDLAAIPAVLLNPLGTKVYYGQPNQGLVELEVTLALKDKILKILSLI